MFSESKYAPAPVEDYIFVVHLINRLQQMGPKLFLYFFEAKFILRVPKLRRKKFKIKRNLRWSLSRILSIIVAEEEKQWERKPESW